jgi:hypothetical protein
MKREKLNGFYKAKKWALEKMELSIQKQKGFYLKKNSLKKEKYKNE